MQDTFIYKGQMMTLEDAFKYLLNQNKELRDKLDEQILNNAEVERFLLSLIEKGDKNENEVRQKVNSLNHQINMMRLAYNLV